MTQRRMLDEIVDATDARVLIERDEHGRVRSARFDLAGLPRVDGMLVGRPIGTVPALVERLCSICPAAHHLAGTRALEALAGLRPTATATAVRQLLHHGSAVRTHAARALAADRDDALLLHRFGGAAMAAAGSPGYFPDTAVPGGVRAPVSQRDRDDLAAQLPEALAAARRIARRLLAEASPVDRFAGADVALADPDGTPDLLGVRLRAVAADGAVLEAAAPSDRWDDLVAEAVPGDPAPRPYLVALGPERGRYRVGPVAQLRVGALGTPVAAGLQAAWLAAHAGARAARAVMAVHSTEAIGLLLDREELVRGPVGATAGTAVGATAGATAGTAAGPAAGSPVDLAAGVGVGWVDGPRGLLVHRYVAAADGTLAEATLLTPTAQNEPWLAELLGRAAGAVPRGVDPAVLHVEAAIREADPCLPCSSAPSGAMGVRLETVAAGARPPRGGR